MTVNRLKPSFVYLRYGAIYRDLYGITVYYCSFIFLYFVYILRLIIQLCAAHGVYGAEDSGVGVSLVYLAQELRISLGELGTAGLVVLAAQVHCRNVNGSCAVVPGDIVGGPTICCICNIF